MSRAGSEKGDLRPMESILDPDFVRSNLEQTCHKPCSEAMPRLMIALLDLFIDDLKARSTAHQGGAILPRDVAVVVQSIPEYEFARGPVEALQPP
jgi:hypothetical protein